MALAGLVGVANFLLLPLPHTRLSNSVSISSDFFSSRKVVDETDHVLNPALAAPRRRNAYEVLLESKADRALPKTLVGIISSDTRNDATYRKRHRELFDIWKDPRVCSLADWQRNPQGDCQLMYTFVVGANPEGPTEIVDDTVPLLYESPMQSAFSDIQQDDVTRLNIR